MPKLYIIAGPNGAGKTTFAKEFLPHYVKSPNFVNADLIAQGLAPFSPTTVRIKAGRLLLTQIQEFIKQKSDFAFETTLAGRSYVSLIDLVKRRGYSVHIFFLWIPDIKLAHERIKQRVKEGGHNIPFQDIKRRFKRSMTNFINLYRSRCSSWIIFDNSTRNPLEIARSTGEGVKIFYPELYTIFLGGVKNEKE